MGFDLRSRGGCPSGRIDSTGEQKADTFLEPGLGGVLECLGDDLVGV